MKRWWKNLSDRDRSAVMVLALVATAFAYWLGIWRPLQSSVAQQASRIAALESDAAWLSAAAEEVRLLRNEQREGGRRGGQSLLALAEQSARGAGLGGSFRRGEPVGRDKVRVWLEAASFDDVMRWMNLLEGRYAVTVEETTITRTGSAGLVDLSALLAE